MGPIHKKDSVTIRQKEKKTAKLIDSLIFFKKIYFKVRKIIRYQLKLSKCFFYR